MQDAEQLPIDLVADGGVAGVQRGGGLAEAVGLAERLRDHGGMSSGDGAATHLSRATLAGRCGKRPCIPRSCSASLAAKHTITFAWRS